MFRFCTIASKRVSYPIFRTTHRLLYVNANQGDNSNQELKILNECMTKALKELDGLNATENYEKNIIKIMNNTSEDIQHQLGPRTADKDMLDRKFFEFVIRSIEKSKKYYENDTLKNISSHLNTISLCSIAAIGYGVGSVIGSIIF